MIRRLYYVGGDVSTRYQSKPIQLPSGTRALRVKPDDLNTVLELAERSGYTRDEIRAAVGALNELHNSGDRSFGDWQEAFDWAAEKCQLRQLRERRLDAKKKADIAQWPAAAAHRRALDAVFGQVSKASGPSTPEALVKELPLHALSGHSLPRSS